MYVSSDRKKFSNIFLGNWTPKLLNRDSNYIKKESLFILPTIKYNILSIDFWERFSQKEWADVKFWHHPSGEGLRSCFGTKSISAEISLP